MEQIRIAVTVSLSAAVAGGRAQCGDTTVALSDADIAGLSDAAKSLLTRCRGRASELEPATFAPLYDGGSWRPERLPVDDATVTEVIAALEARAIVAFAAEDTNRAERSRAAAKAAAAREAGIVQALAQPDSEWFSEEGPGDYYMIQDGQVALMGESRRAPVLRACPGLNYLDDQQRQDPRIVALRERLTAGLAVRHAEFLARVAEYRALVAAVKAAAAAALETYHAAIRDLARQEDDLARPAADGYAVERAMLDRLAERLGKAVSPNGGAIQYLIDSRTWGDEPDRPAPSPDAFALLDRVNAAALIANGLLPASIGQWSVSRVVRVDVCEHEGEKHIVTAVIATLKTPTAIREITFSLESLACDHDDGDES